MTPDILMQAIPGTKSTDAEKYAPVLDEQMEKYGINTPALQAAFLAQCAHECANFSVVTENLNYSADALSRVFGKYFGTLPGKKNAATYARKPEMIANVVYANRMGNGNEASGDGWKYRGRGGIQLTGKNNYVAYAAESGADVVNNPDLLLTPEHVIGSACFYWKRNRLNAIALPNTEAAMIRLSKAINLGNPDSDQVPNGLADRLAKWKTASVALGA